MDGQLVVIFHFNAGTEATERIKEYRAEKLNIDDENILVWPDQFCMWSPSLTDRYVHFITYIQPLKQCETTESRVEAVVCLLANVNRSNDTRSIESLQDLTKGIVLSLEGQIEEPKLLYSPVKLENQEHFCVTASFSNSNQLGRALIERVKAIQEQCVSSDLQIAEEDTQTLHERSYISTEIVSTEEEDLFYYQSQCVIASTIMERLKLLLKIYHNKTLQDFTDFEFQIYTARSKMLQEQTCRRLADERSNCIPNKAMSSAERYSEANKRVHKYVKSVEVQERRDELEQRARREPHTLFLIVGDEAHWGICHTTRTGNLSASNVLINTWDNTFPNVFVLLVTATPYNLLTGGSRVPLDKRIARNIENPELWHQIKETGKSGSKRYQDEVSGSDVTGQIGNVKSLHVIKWSEGLTEILGQGIKVKLKMASSRGLRILQTLAENDDQIKLKWSGTTEDACKGFNIFQIKSVDGEGSTVQIETENREYRLMVVSNENGEDQLLFHKIGIQAQHFQDKFVLKSVFGHGIFELHVNLRHGRKALTFDNSTNLVQLGRQPDAIFQEGEDCGFPVHSPNFSFIVDWQEDQVNTKQYLSMNTVFNSMRSEDMSCQLIRVDDEFKEVIQGFRKREPTGKGVSLKRQMDVDPADVLAADYCYHVLVLPLFKDFSLATESAVEMLQHLDKALGNYITKKTLRIKAFMQELKTKNEENNNFKPISPETFSKYINIKSQLARERMLDAMQGIVRQRNDKEDIMHFFEDLFLCLLYLQAEDYAAIGECQSLRALRSNEELLMMVEEVFVGKVMTNIQYMKANTVVENETARIVDDLTKVLSPDGKLSGHMKIVRTPTVATGNCFYSSLILARKVSGVHAYEVLRDFENFTLAKTEITDDSSSHARTPIFRIHQALQSTACTYRHQDTYEGCSCMKYEVSESSLRCEKCDHVHKTIGQYSDLEGLPCILILVEKGRMGDTFPGTFNVMDLRLQYNTKSARIRLSTVVQELGRMCRYRDTMDHLPYALVGTELEKKLQEFLKKSASYYGGFMEKKMIDPHVARKKKQPNGSLPGAERVAGGIMAPSLSNYDRENVEQHKNRILLDAEPQIGKTGVYLLVISTLRKEILGEGIIPNGTACESEYESEEDSDTEEDSEEVPRDDAQLWQYPYWKSMEEQATNKISKYLPDSKYAKVYGPYRQNVKPENLIRDFVPKIETKRLRSFEMVHGVDDKYRAYDRTHKCVECDETQDTVLVEIPSSFTSEKLRLSVPNNSSQYFRPLLKRLLELFPDLLQCIGFQGNPVNEDQILSNWIFMPSFNRSVKGCLNWRHAMVKPDQNTNNVIPFGYVHIVVVRKEEFAVYRDGWGNTHAILELPDEMLDSETEVDEGGIGYARLFIQRFAEMLSLPYIFMVDDNIATMYKVSEESGRIVRDDEGAVKWKNTPFLEVLLQLENHVEGKGVAPVEVYEPFCSEAPGLHSYTGTPRQYAVLGILKYRGTIGLVKRPFKHYHVHSCVLLNIALLKEKGIRYKPWQVFEDCNLNNEADDHGLWVCKYSKYVMTKRRSNKWFPCVYYWKDDTNLLLSLLCEMPADHLTHLIRWVKASIPPRKVYIWPPSGLDSSVSQMWLELRQCSRTSGSSNIFVIHDSDGVASYTLEDVKAKIIQFLQDGQRIEINKHLLILSAVVMRKFNLVTKRKIKQFLNTQQDEYIQRLEVITTQNPHLCGIESVMVYLEGKERRETVVSDLKEEAENSQPERSVCPGQAVGETSTMPVVSKVPPGQEMGELSTKPIRSKVPPGQEMGETSTKPVRSKGPQEQELGETSTKPVRSKVPPGKDMGETSTKTTTRAIRDDTEDRGVDDKSNVLQMGEEEETESHHDHSEETGELSPEDVEERVFNFRGHLQLLDVADITEGEFSSILIYQQLWSGYTFLRAIKEDDIVTIATILGQIFTDFGPPYILQSGIGNEEDLHFLIQELNEILQEVHIIAGIQPDAQPESVKKVVADIWDNFPYHKEKKLPHYLSHTQWFINTVSSEGNTPYEAVFEGKQRETLSSLLKHEKLPDTELDLLSMMYFLKQSKQSERTTKPSVKSVRDLQHSSRVVSDGEIASTSKSAPPGGRKRKRDDTEMSPAKRLHYQTSAESVPPIKSEQNQPDTS